MAKNHQKAVVLAVVVEMPIVLVQELLIKVIKEVKVILQLLAAVAEALVKQVMEVALQDQVETEFP